MTPTTAPGGGGGGSSPLLPLAFVLAAAGAVAVVVLRGRAPGRVTPVAAGPAPSGAANGVAGPSPLTHELLEVSRQLTAAAARGDVGRAIVRGALTLVPADAAALVATAPSLTVDAESHPGTLLPEGLAGGVVARVAETGEHISQVSASEPAVRHLPAALLALPLVSAGRVDSVLVAVRAADLPFGEADVKVLRALVPMAAAALGAQRHAQSAIDESLRDPLTGAGNRRRFDQDLTDALAGGASGGGPLSLGIIDLDHFKRVNDTHGHPAGDALLRAVVQRAHAALRPGDALYRFGGEEFCFLLADASAEEAMAVAERVRAAIAAEPFDVGAAEPLVATASIGVAAAGSDGPALLAAADAALYRAKESGRNRVVSG